MLLRGCNQWVKTFERARARERGAHSVVAPHPVLPRLLIIHTPGTFPEPGSGSGTGTGTETSMYPVVTQSLFQPVRTAGVVEVIFENVNINGEFAILQLCAVNRVKSRPIR